MKKTLLFLLMVAYLLQTSCASNRSKGAIIGAAAGGAIGALLTDDNKAMGILLGAAVGGTAGALIGAYMDAQAKDLKKDLENAEVIRKDEGIYIVFDSGLLFDYDSANLRDETRKNLNSLATSLGEYEKTKINILGHTDSTGPNEYNEKLSKERAGNVKMYLQNQGVEADRLNALGYGETDPVTTNATSEGRQMNRRVEIVITAGEEMVEDAMNGNLTVNK